MFRKSQLKGLLPDADLERLEKEIIRERLHNLFERIDRSVYPTAASVMPELTKFYADRAALEELKE